MAFAFTFTYSLNLWHEVMGPEGFGYRLAAGRRMGEVLRIGEVFPNRPFSNAGMQSGDNLTAINGDPLKSAIDLDSPKRKSASGSQSRLMSDAGQSGCG